MNFSNLLNQAQEFIRNTLHEQTNADTEYSYLILDQNGKKLQPVYTSLQKRCEGMGAVSVLHIQNSEDIVEECLDLSSGFRCFNLICLTSETELLTVLLKKLHKNIENEEIGGRMAFQCLKLNIFFVFTFEDIRNGVCFQNASAVAGIFHEMFKEQKYFPNCDVLYMCLRNLNESFLSILAGQIFYLQVFNQGEQKFNGRIILNATEKDYIRFQPDDYPWTFYTVQETYTPEMILFHAIRNCIESMFIDSEQVYCDEFDREMADNVRKQFLREMELESFNTYFEECCCYVPMPSNEDEWKEKTPPVKEEVIHVPADPEEQSGFLKKLLRLLPGGKNAAENSVRTEIVQTPVERWNKDSKKLETSYKEYIQRRMSPEAFYKMIFYHTKYAYRCNTVTSRKIQEEIHRIIRDVFADSQQPIWKEIEKKYDESLDTDTITEECEQIYNALNVVKGEIDTQIKTWKTGVTFSITTKLFETFLQKNLKLHMSDASSIYEQLIRQLQDFQTSPEAAQAFQEDCQNAEGAFPSNPTMNLVDETSRHNLVPQFLTNQTQNRTYNLFWVKLDSLNAMRK